MTITTISYGNAFSNAHFARDRTDIVPSGGFTIDPGVAGALGSGGSAAPVPVVSSGVVLSGPVVPQAFYQLVEKGGVTVDAHVSGGSQFVFGRTTGTFIEASSRTFPAYDGHQVVETGGRAVRTRIGEGGEQYVSTGAAAYGTAIVGGSQVVDSGLAEFTTVMDGDQTVYAGGRAIKTRIGAGGAQYVEGGRTSDTVVVNGGSQFVFSGTAIGTVVQKGGVEVVESGVVVSGLTVSSGGEVVIDGGGSLVDAHIAEGAIVFQEVLSSGMSASGVFILSGFSQTVLSGASAADSTVLSGGTVILGGGAVTGLTVSSGGTEIVTNSVTVSAVTVGDGVTLNLNSGATASGETVGRGGLEQVVGDAKSVDATVSGTQYVVDGGVASNTTVASGGEQFIIGSGSFLGEPEAPGSASGTVVKAGGTLITSHGFIGGGDGVITSSIFPTPPPIIVLSSGVGIVAANSDISPNSGGVTDVTIESGGVFIAGDGIVSGGTVKSGGKIILEGAVLSGLTVEKGGIEIVGNGGYLVASKGMVLSDVQVFSGGEVVYAGGRFVGLEVSSGALEFVESGGVLRNADVGDGVSLSVLSGGRASGVHVGSGGSVALYGGGKVSGLTLDAGATETLGSGTRFDRVTISSGLTVRVADGAVLTNVKVQSGGQIVYAGGTVSGLTLAKGGRVGVDTDVGSSAGIPSSGVTLYQNGYEQVRGGQVIRTIVSGGHLIMAGGKSVNTQIHAGGVESLYSGSVAKDTIVVGQVSYSSLQSSLPFISHSELDIESGTAVGVAVAGGGILLVGSGGKAAGVSVKKGGTIVFAGGAVTGLKLGSGATEELQHGAKLSGAIIEGGLTVIVDGPFSPGSAGSAVDAMVGKGGTIIDLGGTITGLKLQGGGTEIVGSESFVSKATVIGGATLIVSSGGAIGNSVILGGRETVLSGGTVIGTVTFGKHGRFAIAGEPSGLTVSGFHSGDLLELSSFQHDESEKLHFVENADNTKGVLTIADGGMRATITLFGQYVAAGFHLAADPAGGTAISYATSASAHVDLAVGHG